MNKILTVILVVLVGLFIGLGGYGLIQNRNEKGENLSGFLTQTITNTSSSANLSDTLVIGVAENLQYFRITNVGSGRALCRFNTTTTLSTGAANTGFVINPTGSSTLTAFETYDANMLKKALHCYSPDTTSTLSILKY